MRFFGFDSFEGFPEQVGIDTKSKHFPKGTYVCSLESFFANIEGAGVHSSKVVPVKGYFQDTLNEETRHRLGIERISVAHIDSDLYESARLALDFIAPALMDGSVIVFDEWFQYRGNPERGEHLAFTEWMARHPEFVVSEYQRGGLWNNSFIVNIAERESWWIGEALLDPTEYDLPTSVEAELGSEAVLGGTPLCGIVKLDKPAPVGGTRVFMWSDQRFVSAQEQVIVVPEGEREAPFNVPTGRVDRRRDAKLFVSLLTGDGCRTPLQVRVHPRAASKPLELVCFPGRELHVRGSRIISQEALGVGQTVEAVDAPANASAFEFESDGSFSYVPREGSFCDDLFTYRVVSPLGASDVATVKIKVRPVLEQLLLDSDVIASGSPFTGKVVLTAPAGPGGVRVHFDGGVPCVLAVGRFVDIAEGEDCGLFELQTIKRTRPFKGVIRASLRDGSGVSLQANVTATPA